MRPFSSLLVSILALVGVGGASYMTYLAFNTPPIKAEEEKAAAPNEAKAPAVVKDDKEPGLSLTINPTLKMFGYTPYHNMVDLVNKNPPTDWDVKKKTNVKWVAKLGSRAYGGPIIADGKVFVGTNNEAVKNSEIKGDKGVLMCFNEEDGKFLWQAVHDKLPAGRVHDWPREGICSTPTVEGKYVYYVCNRGEVICASVDGYQEGKTQPTHPGYTSSIDGGVIWRFDMLKEYNVNPHNMTACSPLIVGDYIFIVTGNGVDEGHINIPSPEAPSFLALNKKTGKPIWRDNSPGKQIMHGQWSNPTYIEVDGKPQIVFPGGDGWIRSFEPRTGEIIWKFDANPKDSKYDLGGKGTRSDFIGTPVFYEGKVYIGVGQDPEHNTGIGRFWCIDPSKKGDVSPDLVTDNTVFPPKTKPNPNSAAVWQFGGAAPPAERAVIRRNYYFDRTLSTAAIHDGLLYIADYSGRFFCLDAKTGKQYWTYDLEDFVWGSPQWIDGKVFIGNDAGAVHIFAHGKKEDLIAKVEMDTAIRSNLAMAHGVLYVMTGTHLYAIKAK